MEKRIVIRVESETWQAFDDKRHAERTSFQELGLTLFQQWLNGDRKIQETATQIQKSGVKINTSGSDNLPIEDSEVPWVQCLLGILRSGNTIASRAISSNLLTFMDYVKNVPEVPGGLADLAAQAERLAALDRKILDTIKAAPMGGSGSASQPRKRNAPGSRRT